MLAPKCFGKARRNKSFTVKLGNRNIRRFLHTGIFAHRIIGSVILYRDNIYIFHDRLRIFNNDDFLIRKNARIAISRSACKKKRVIGIELTELTITDIHTEHHTLPKRLVHIGSHES